jgi:hypothetical protein
VYRLLFKEVHGVPSWPIRIVDGESYETYDMAHIKATE